jgi:hypothetical protein
MNLAEKIGQLAQIGGVSVASGSKPEEVIRKGGAGSVFWLNDTKQLNVLQGWPNRFMVVTYLIWLIIIAEIALRIH